MGTPKTTSTRSDPDVHDDQDLVYDSSRRVSPYQKLHSRGTLGDPVKCSDYKPGVDPKTKLTGPHTGSVTLKFFERFTKTTRRTRLWVTRLRLMVTCSVSFFFLCSIYSRLPSLVGVHLVFYEKFDWLNPRGHLVPKTLFMNSLTMSYSLNFLFLSVTNPK